jgi:hypothetical protein
MHKRHSREQPTFEIVRPPDITSAREWEPRVMAAPEQEVAMTPRPDPRALRFRVVRSPDAAIARARELLTGLVTDRWPPRPPGRDPWNLRLETGPAGRRELRDDLDDHSVFCVLDCEGHIVAVWRLTILTPEICPLAAYRPLAPELPAFLRRDAAEGARLFVVPPLRKTIAPLLLLRGSFRWLMDEARVTWVYTTCQPPLTEHFLAMGMLRAAAPDFVFAVDDPKRSTLLYIDVRRGARILDDFLGGGSMAA